MSNQIAINPIKKEINVLFNKQTIVVNAVNPIFTGHDVFIVGGGNSLEGFNFNLLKDKKVIVINKSLTKVPFAQVLYFSDYRFYMWAIGALDNDTTLIKAFKEYNGFIYTIAPLKKDTLLKDRKIINLFNSGTTGLDTRNGYLKNGGNSGYAAINLAYHLGAKRIILMGYDMKFTKGKSHFHEGYLSKQSDKVYKRFIEPFNSLSLLAEQLHLPIYNTSLNSDLPYFKKIPIEHFL